MSVKVKCTSCEAVFAVHERVLGSTVACPRCDFKLTLPTAEELAEFQRSLAEKAKLAEKEKRRAAKRAQLALQPAQQIETEPQPKAPPVRRRKREREHEGLEEAWDITPMVDVVFLLLIFFILTASFSIQKVIRTGRQLSDQPSSNASSDKDPENAGPVVQVDEFNSYAVVSADDREEVSSKQDLIIALSRLKEQSSGDDMETLTVQAHEESTHGAVVGALDAGRAAKFNRFKTVMVEQF
ncbi:MAG: biopolymer transporter ExbD [Pirellulaceae bacterium]|nr:biopolymer transporter ExbD [Pirellulaceae bacterium]